MRPLLKLGFRVVSRISPALAATLAERLWFAVPHSGGSAAAAWALRQTPTWPVKRMVFIAPFGSPARYMAVFQSALGLSDAVMRRFRESTERRFGFRWADLEVPAIAERVKTPPLLVIHDRGDRETAWQDGHRQSMAAFRAAHDQRAVTEFAFATAILVIATLLAAVLPARRAARTDPAVVLRGD